MDCIRRVLKKLDLEDLPIIPVNHCNYLLGNTIVRLMMNSDNEIYMLQGKYEVTLEEHLMRSKRRILNLYYEDIVVRGVHAR